MSVYNAYVYGMVDEAGRHSYPTYDELAEQFGCSVSRVSHVASRGSGTVPGDWVTARERFSGELADRVREDDIERRVEAAAENRKRYLDEMEVFCRAICYSLFRTDSYGRLIEPPRFRDKITISDIVNYVELLRKARADRQASLGQPLELSRVNWKTCTFRSEQAMSKEVIEELVREYWDSLSALQQAKEVSEK